MSAANDKASIAIRETANEWAARLAAPDLSHADKVAFAAWLRTSPVHIREYLNAEALRLMVETAVQTDTTDVRALLDEAPGNVVELEANSIAPSRRAARAPWIMRIAAAVLLLVGAAGAWILTGSLASDSHSTVRGEIRRVVLPDGSTVELNTDTKISVDFAADRRDIQLRRGEAFFVVARDPARPFRVLSDTARIRAVGTQFSVYRKQEQTVVTVLEGKVAAENDHDTLELTAGNQVVLESASGTATLPIEPVHVDAKRVTSWRQHRLIFDNEPLANVVAEFNRYNRQQLVIADPELAAQRISGVFDPDKPGGLVLFLNRKGAVQATEGPGSTLVLRR
jgi:transmembrane sensor